MAPNLYRPGYPSEGGEHSRPRSSTPVAKPRHGALPRAFFLRVAHRHVGGAPAPGGLHLGQSGARIRQALRAAHPQAVPADAALNPRFARSVDARVLAPYICFTSPP